MRLHLGIAGGYMRTIVKSIQANNPSYTYEDAVKTFAEEKYGNWIKVNQPSAVWHIHNVVADAFDITFDSDAEGEFFRRTVGGKIVESN